MTLASDPELIGFCAELIEKGGGLIDSEPSGLLALLPSPLAQELKIPQELRLGSEEALLLYGSPFLDRLIDFATRNVPVVYGHIQAPYLKKAGFEKLFCNDILFADGLVRITGRAEARTTYMVLVCHYLAMSDERREGLVQIGLQESSGAFIDRLEVLAEEFKPSFYESGKIPPHFPVHLDHALEYGAKRAKALVQEELSDFLSSMQRRLQRDTMNTREYYKAMGIEMEAGLSHPNLAEAQREERLAKIAELPLEMARKVKDLEQKYQVRITITACAALRFLVDVVQLLVELKHRKLDRSLRMIWNPITRRLDPLVCDLCHETINKICLSRKNSDILLLCSSCSRKNMQSRQACDEKERI